MGLANCITLFVVIICLSLCSGHRVVIDSIDSKAGKRSGILAHVKIAKTAPLFHSNSSNDDYDDDDDDPPIACAGGLGYSQDVGPESCCCQPCGPGQGPSKLPDMGYLDPDEDSCCPPVEPTVEAEAYWGCCNCPDGIWILRWNSSGGPMMDFNFGSPSDKQPSYKKLEKVGP